MSSKQEEFEFGENDMDKIQGDMKRALISSFVFACLVLFYETFIHGLIFMD